METSTTTKPLSLTGEDTKYREVAVCPTTLNNFHVPCPSTVIKSAGGQAGRHIDQLVVAGVPGSFLFSPVLFFVLRQAERVALAQPVRPNLEQAGPEVKGQWLLGGREGR